LRVARDKSLDRAADIAAASELLMRAKPQAPNSSDIAFKEGMLNKLQGRFEQASADFQRATRLDPTHWNAAAQYAHVMIFLGGVEQGFALMEPAAKNLLPDLGAAETAYIAGETALAAGAAVRYLNMAISLARRRTSTGRPERRSGSGRRAGANTQSDLYAGGDGSTGWTPCESAICRGADEDG
jgi:tetratricopeptide (TPR) repeat protein